MEIVSELFWSKIDKRDIDQLIPELERKYRSVKIQARKPNEPFSIIISDKYTTYRTIFKIPHKTYPFEITLYWAENLNSLVAIIKIENPSPSFSYPCEHISNKIDSIISPYKRKRYPLEPTTLEGWIVPAYGALGLIIDHTFVYCPEKNSHFYCFDPLKLEKTSPGAKLICRSHTSAGAYEIANLYRRPIEILPDTGGIHVYAVNGVCHQATNCFLYAAGISLFNGNTNPLKCVKGFAASFLGYGLMGTYGLSALGVKSYHKMWLNKYYNPAKKEIMTKYDIKKIRMSVTDSKIDSDFIQSIDVNKPFSQHDYTLYEFRLMAERQNPDLDTSKFKDIHRDYLKDKDRMIELDANIDIECQTIKMPSGKQADDLITKMNDLSVGFQESLSQRIGHQKYKQLTGSNDFYNIIDPKIARENWKQFE